MAGDYERQCENWLATFADWTLPVSEAQETLHFWTGIYTLAAALRRHVKIPREYLGGWECAPNVYIMFVADPGKARKTTTVNFSEDLLDELPDLTQSPELITKESLLTTLVKSVDTSMAIRAPEFGEFIVKSGVEMYGWLTNMYDGKKKISASTLSRGLEFAEKPCVNMIGATTPVWIAKNMPEDVIGGGFASRVIFVYEDTVRRRKMFYRDVNHSLRDEFRLKLVEDLKHIAANIYGDFELTEDALEYMEDWYRATADIARPDEYKLHGYYERKPAHVLKLSMVLHLAYSDSLLLVKEDIEAAIQLIEQVERKLPTAFEAIGANPHTVDMTRIHEYVQRKGEIEKGKLYEHFRHVAMPSVLDEMITGLVTIGYLRLRTEGTKIYFKNGDKN